MTGVDAVGLSDDRGELEDAVLVGCAQNMQARVDDVTLFAGLGGTHPTSS